MLANLNDKIPSPLAEAFSLPASDVEGLLIANENPLLSPASVAPPVGLKLNPDDTPVLPPVELELNEDMALVVLWKL